MPIYDQGEMYIGKYVGHMQHLGYRINGKNSILTCDMIGVFFWDQ